MATDKNVKFISGTQTINDYLADVRKFDVLTKEDEKDLFIRYKSGDMSARDEIILKNQRFIYSLAKVYAVDENDIMDYVQVGNIGLIEAIDSFDIEKDYKFITYAVWYIRRSMNYYMTNDHDIITKSNNMKFGKKIEKIKNDFFKKECRYPTHDEIVDILNEKYQLEVKNISDVYDLSVNSISMDVDDEYTYEDTSEFASRTASYNEFDSECDDEYSDDSDNIAAKILSMLPTKHSDIIKKYYGIGGEAYSIDELADEYGMYPSAMEKLINKSIKFLQENTEDISAFRTAI